ncbi:MAG: hypothetical protein ABIS50_11185 [Luteolibacter sp.]|uniref:hypothetical protein n=1 Tax=Luteolibacter sp. TaxID=1962973 RepID=UPI0032640DA5
MIPRLLALATLLPGFLSAEILDTLSFGNDASESLHELSATFSDFKPGGLGEPARRLLPGGELAWQGGILKFVVRVDPEKQNYITLRLWGEDVNHNQMTLHVEGKQLGYRHLGDYEALETGSDAPAYPGRFIYRTCPLPLDLTKGRDCVNCEIRATGPIWGYATSFEQYQKPMTEPTRGLYRAYTHTDGCFTPPADDKQGVYPENAPVRITPGPEVMDAVKSRVNGEIDNQLKDVRRPCNQMQILFLAKAWHTPWTHAAGKPETITKIQTSLDALYRAYVANPKLAEEEPSTYNPDWFGLGPSGQVIASLENELKPGLDESIDDGKGGKIKRRDAFSAMLVVCRDWHREHRRQYTNQSMINDLYGIYLANRGVAVLAPSLALPEKQALRYLYESIGLEPWLGSEKDGKPTKPLGDSYYQLTAKGLTKELGFVGNYGEVLDWVAQIYEATKPSPDKPGDPKVKRQMIKIAMARSPFRYPMLDGEGNRAMVQETIVGWRDTHYPGDVTYDQRPSWDGSAFEVATDARDPKLIGFSQQMLADNQFFAVIFKQMENNTFRTTFGLMGVPERYEFMKAQKPVAHRLPMSWDQPDFVFTDEEDGVVAIKNGKEILYASLYWRARNAVNFLGRVHYLTPTFDRIATVMEDIDYTPSGMEYTRPNWTNFGFGNGGHPYPANYTSAHTGEKLPIAKIPAGVSFKPGEENIYAGRGDFYQLRYGPYLIAMNMSADKTFDLKAPDHAGKMTNLVTRNPVKPGGVAKVAPRTTVVIFQE